MSNERRFTSIVDLEDDFVIAVPEDTKPKDVLEDAISTSHLEYWKFLHYANHLKATRAELLEHPTDKVRDIKARYRTMLKRRLAHPSAPLEIRTTNFLHRYADILISSTKNNRVVLVEAKMYGRAKVNADYIYQKIKVKVGSADKVAMFQPSKFLRDPSKMWTLKALAGEKLFAKELEANYGVIDGDFIEMLIAKVDLPFYLSADKGYLFGAPLEIHKAEHGPLKKLTAKQALKLLSVPALERVVEQGSAKL